MIRTEKDYQQALKRLQDDLGVINQQRQKLAELGLSEDEAQVALEPALCFHEQLKEEVAAYEKNKRGELGPIYSLESIGRVLIGLRIAFGLSQREFAEKLGVSEAAVSRDERNEYHGISVERAQKILETFNVKPTISFDDVA